MRPNMIKSTSVSVFHRAAEVLTLLALVSGCLAQSYLDSNIEDELGLNTSQVLRLRGYMAKDHTVSTEDDYDLNVVEAWNPLIDYDRPEVAQRQPVMFWHGTLGNATCFITDTPKPASPKDYSKYNASQMSKEQIETLYKGSPNSQSLVFILLDFGYRVFLVNRRNTLASQKAYAMRHNISFTGEAFNNGSAAAAKALLDSLGAGLPAPLNNTLDALTDYLDSLASAFDPVYWDFSLDEMAKYDVRAVVKFILKLLKRRTLVAIGWSSGGAILEMALSTQPDLNEMKTFRSSFFYTLAAPILAVYDGPVFPQFFFDVFDALATRICSTELAQQTICQGVLDLIAGYGDGQQRLKPGFFNAFPAPTSSHEFGQLGGFTRASKPRYYDFGPAKNQAKYGSVEPPTYYVSNITSKGLYFWAGGFDGLVSMADITRNVNDLSVPYKLTKLDQPGIFFEHFSYVFHKHKFELLFVDCLRIIESN